MPSLHCPPKTMLSGLGIAGAVLAAVLVTFTLASGLVAYTFTSDDPLTPSASTLVLDPLRAGDLDAAPLVLRGAPPAARKRSSVRAAVTSPRGEWSSGSLTPRAGGRRADLGQPGAGGGPAAPGASVQPSTIGASGPREPVDAALDGPIQTVGATSESLASRLQGVTSTLQAQLEPLATGTGDALRTVAGDATRTLGRLLHRPSG